MSKEYYTVVYEVIGDKAIHDEWWRSLQPLFLKDNAPISIIVISKGDLISQIEIEMAQRRVA